MSTLVGRRLRIEGTICGEDAVLILGHVRGRVESQASITVQRGAVVEAELVGRQVFIADGASFLGRVDLLSEARAPARAELRGRRG